MVHLVRDPKGETVLELSSTTDKKLNIIPTKYVSKTQATTHIVYPLKVVDKKKESAKES